MTWKPDKLDELFADEKAVSPVVGVALLIAMTVILAAVIGTVVLGLGSNPAEAPQASFDFEYNGADTVEVTHDGGDALDEGEVSILVNGEEDTSAAIPAEWTAGQSVDVDNDAAGVNSGDTITVVWEDSDSDKTSTLAEYEV